jgi:hypothetical protein
MNTLTRLLSASIFMTTVFGHVCPKAIQAEVAVQNLSGLAFLGSEATWRDAPSYPGAKICLVEGNPYRPGPLTIRLKFSPNAKISPQSNAADARYTILSGSVHIVRDLNVPTVETLCQGDYWFIPAGVPFAAWTTEELIVQVQGTGPWIVTAVSAPDFAFDF